MFVTRDNRDHRTDIERHYRAAIRLARQRVIIANAYFFPGYRLLKEMRKAARRGVRGAADPAGRARHADREDGPRRCSTTTCCVPA